MSEPFDELMGPPPSKKSAPAGPSPTAAVTRSSSSLSSGAAPPSNAFVHTKSADRWAQYERDGDQLQRDSAQANANAVLAAAERAADREPVAMPSKPYYDDPEEEFQDRLQSGGASLDPPERRAPARRAAKAGMFSNMLNKSSRAISSSSNRYEEETINYSDSHDRVRAEAMKVLKMANSSDSHDEGPGRIRRTATGGYTTEERSNGPRRRPAALAGLDLSAASNRPSRVSHSRFTIDDHDLDEEEDDMVDIINMESRASLPTDPNTGGYTDDTDAMAGTTRSSTWSSRYSMDTHLRALNGMTNSEMLARMEQDQERNHVSARNMFSTSPHESTLRSPTKIFGSGFTFRKKHVFDPASPPSDFNLQSHKTVWTDGIGTDWSPDSGGSPHFPPQMPSPSHHWQEGLARKRRYRRRACLLACLAILAVIITAAVIGTKSGGGGTSASVAPVYPEGSSTFYVTADVPFSLEEEKKMNLDLVSLPDTGDFVVHLGNIQQAAVTMCPPTIYHDVGVVLRTSNLPMFLVPGEDDWNNCPNPTRALTQWKEEYVPFERHWRHPYNVDRMLGQEENFSFVSKGVLFVGLHLVAGRIDDPDQWTLRHAKNARWLADQLHLFNQKGFRAVVLFGNARPSYHQREFFADAVATIEKIGKPALYVHSSSGDGSETNVYQPFSKLNNFMAAEISDGGKTRPLLINVGFGRKPFTIGEEP